VQAELEGVETGREYRLRAKVTKAGQPVMEFNSGRFQATDLVGGTLSFSAQWLPDALWDIHTPENQFDLDVSLEFPGGPLLDQAWTTRFGFREFWIDGRDFHLNGSRIFLSVVPLDNAQVSTALASYEGACESLRRLQSFGINFVYTHNYDCLPGSHLSFAEILRAADDVGMLVAFSQPHFSHYDWQLPDADERNGYADHAAFYVRAARKHPSVVAYAMSHNATGYSEDMNPDMIDGIQDARDSWALRNVAKAERAEAIVKRLDPTRIVYHHASGNLGPLHAINFYPNFVPVQEMSDWFEHWATGGVKPVFLCEYAAPFTWDWTLYRGWYQGRREFGSAQVPWEFCIAEWNAQFLGDEAYRISEAEKTNLRWEARQYREGRVWHRWDYPHQVGSTVFEERYPIFARYLTENWRAFRTWGVSAISPWEHGHFWRLRDGVDKKRCGRPVIWQHLQRPGFSPDYVDQRYERMDLAFEREDWIATPAAQALLRNNRPLLGYIAGKPGAFTSRDHNFLPGETIGKQLIVINNSRRTVDCVCEWRLDLPQEVAGRTRIAIPTGQQRRVPIEMPLPATLPYGAYDLTARFTFRDGEVQEDAFTVNVLPPVSAASSGRPLTPPHSSQETEQVEPARGRPLLFDPKGETAALLTRLGVHAKPVKEQATPSAHDLLILGQGAVTLEGRLPDLSAVRDGLTVIVFEQTGEVLERRLGLRVAEYGLRQVWPRIAEHPALSDLDTDHLRDWRGEATTLPPRLDYRRDPKFNGAPTIDWCGIPVTRLWRCGNRGNVASVLIEKPARGDFLPLLDGGFSLQYSPLIEYREGRGLILFCQMDVTGRTEADPAADRLVRNLLDYATNWRPPSGRQAGYLGEATGRQALADSGIPLVNAFDRDRWNTNTVLILGPGAGRELADRKRAIRDGLQTGGHLLAAGLDPTEIEGLIEVRVPMRKAEHIAAYFGPFSLDSAFAGISPADVHNRDPRLLPLLADPAQAIGDGVLGQLPGLNVVFCQLPQWQFAGSPQANLRRTHRRAAFLLNRILANLGVVADTPLLERLRTPLKEEAKERRWSEGLYADTPQEWDDPYRFFRW
jgi:hypothetical protein